jgi:DNA-binding MarR family transcriptional regulator
MPAKAVSPRCYCAAARKVARRLTRVYESELRAAGINPAQFELLNHLKARPGSSQALLAEAVDADQTTLSRNLKLLVERGWVRWGASAQDRRCAEYRLTAQGRRSLRLALPHWRRARARVEAALPLANAVWQALDDLFAAAD